MSRAMGGMNNAPANLSEAIIDSFVDANKLQEVKEGIQILLGQVLDTNGKAVTPSSKLITTVISQALIVLETDQFEDTIRQEIASSDTASKVFMCLYNIFSAASRKRIEDKVMIEDLRRFGLSRELVGAIVEPFFAKRVAIETAARETRLKNPHIERIEWRVDVTVTSSQLNRVFKPVILFQITTSKGEIKTFECSMDKFHLLRYSVARMLAAVQNIEQNPTLKRLIE